MAEEELSDQAIFEAARRMESREARETYLQQTCGAGQAQRIAALLLALEENASFLESPAVGFGLAPTLHPSVGEKPGTQIGPYKLLQVIGEGGMGVVYMAEQTEPVKRKVALKLIKPGMDSRQIIARFEAERQALAMMDHVNIARVLDAGTTAGEPNGISVGSPYFVMELIHGVPITKYCDDNHLTPRQRLELFVAVCQAIQHAHQKGIIHRDIKPSNVMVTLYDGKPVPKVIDFGVAKATEQKLTERTLFTQYGTMVGTLEYMSPEQAEMSALGIDTRSDIYSLGVLLYELLTGTTPLSQKRMKEVAFAEILRLIKEEEPPRPSTRLSDSGQTLASISALRRTDPAKLTQLMRGELDWIVMKTLEKDRNRRYETANGFAADVLRYLNDEPVLARPPSVWYSVRKFAVRNRVSLVISTLMIGSVLVALSGLGWAIRDRAVAQQHLAQEQSVKQARLSGQIELILDEVTQLATEQKWPEALQSAARAEPLITLDEVRADLRTRVEVLLADLRFIQKLDDIRDRSGTIWGINYVARARRSDEEYTTAFRAAGIDIDSIPVSHVVEQINSHSMIAAGLLPFLDDWIALRGALDNPAAVRQLRDVLHDADPDHWRRQVRDALTNHDRSMLEKLANSDEFDRQPLASVTLICAAFYSDGHHGRKGGSVLHRAQRRFPDDFWINHRLGVNLIYTARREYVLKGIGFMRAAVAIRPGSSHAMMNLGNGYTFLGEDDEALDHFQQALSINPKEKNSGIHINIGILHARQGRFDKAILALDEAISLNPPTIGREFGEFGEGYAELSMIHSSRSDVRNRNVQQALELGNRVVKLAPAISSHWMALGVARYREGQWQDARLALEKSLGLGTFDHYGQLNCYEATSWFFLAMCQQQLGQPANARQSYEKGLVWMKQHNRINESLLRFHLEAAQLLGVSDGGERVRQAQENFDRALAYDSQGLTNLAQESYSLAIEQYELLSVAFPVEQLYTDRLVQLLTKTNRKPETEQVYRRAIPGHGAIVNPSPEQRLAHSFLCNDFAILLHGRSRQEAEVMVREAIQLKQALADEFPDDPLYRFHVAHSELLLALIRAESAPGTTGAQALSQAGSIFQELASAPSSAADFRQWNAHGLWRIGETWLQFKRCEDARQAFGHALHAFKRLAQEYPENRFYRQEQAFTHRHFANVEEADGQLADALEHVRAAVELYQGLFDEAPESVFYGNELVFSQFILIRLLVQDAQFSAAEQAYEQSLAMYPGLVANCEKINQAHFELGEGANNIAWPLVVRPDVSRGAVQLAHRLTDDALVSRPEAGHFWSTLAMVLYREGNWQAALEAIEKAESAGFVSGTTHFFGAMIHWQLGHPEESRKRFTSACLWSDQHESNSSWLPSLREEARSLINTNTDAETGVLR